MKKKKILLSAYSCEPNKGSEPGIGWNWAIQLSKMGYIVKIVTRQNNKKMIEKNLKKFPSLKKENFYYFDLPKIAQILKKKIPGGVYFYYYLWQYFLYKKLKKENFINEIEIIHHLTFGVFRIPSFLWKFNKKFIFGPVGGYELMPNGIFKELKFKNKIIEGLRIFSNFFFIKFDKNLKECVKNSNLFFVKSTDTKKNLRKIYKKKIVQNFEIGTNSVFKRKKLNINKIKILFVGRLLYWKGVDILIDAFNSAIKENDDLTLTICGKGEELKNLKKKSYELKINNKIKFIQSKHNKIKNIYRSHDLFVFPSLHDSSGSVLYEALTSSLPVICLDTGGPADIINDTCGIKIPVKNEYKREFYIKKISEEIVKLCKNKKIYNKLSKGAFARAKLLSWKNTVHNVYKTI